MHTLLIAAAATLPGMAFAVGSGSDSTPTTTETTTECEEGMVWDADAGKCVAPKESSLTDDALYEAARELAYAGRYDDTLRVLAAMSDPMDDRVLTYKGFVHRNLGDKALAEEYYRAATCSPAPTWARATSPRAAWTKPMPSFSRSANAVAKAAGRRSPCATRS